MSFLLANTRAFDFVSTDAWLLLVGVLAAVACAVPGTFLLLRRLSLMGDAISHAVLPGIVVAYLISESRAGWPVFLGAVIVGLVTAYLTESLRRHGKVDESASTGIVFTTLFAVGLLLIARYADKVDLDPNCVLMGNLELVTGKTLGSTAIPESVLSLGLVLIGNLIIVALLFKEFRICSFDPGLAATLGFRPTLMHYLLMTMTALTCVVAFEAVGSILVVALLIVPAAAAHLLTDRLGLTLFIAIAIAALSALLGQWFALDVVPPVVAQLLDQRRSYSLSITGMTATVTGMLLAICIVVSPKHGILVRWRRRAALRRQIAAEDVLGVLCRNAEASHSLPVTDATLLRDTDISSRSLHRLLSSLQRAGHITRQADGVLLTEHGRHEANKVLRSHRLWEAYLVDVANVRADHTHARAHRLEHVPGIADAVAREIRDPTLDPQHKPIPPAG